MEKPTRMALSRRKIIFLALAFMGCALASGTARGQQGLWTVTDKLNRTVTVAVPVARAVVIITYELIPVLGLWDKVVGVSRWAEQECDVYRALLQKHPQWQRPHTGVGTDVNVETILSLRPDVVVTWAYNAKAVEFLEQKGLPVIAVYPDGIGELYEVIRLHGRLFGVEQRTEEVLSGMEHLLNMIRERAGRIPPAARRKVLQLGGKPTTVSCAVGVTNDIIELIGAVNPASTLKQRSTDVSVERIIAWNPDVLFIWGNAGYSPEQILDGALWQHVTAVRQKRVYKLPKWSTWSPRLPLIALWMAQKTYPEVFADVDFEAVADSVYRDFYGISYKAVVSSNFPETQAARKP